MSVIIWPEENTFLQDKEKVHSLFREALQGRVLKAFFFGSFARGEAKEDSDIDLLLVLDTDKPFLERTTMFSDLWQLYSLLDVIVYTPREFKKLVSNPSVGFWQEVVATMIELDL